MRALVVPRRILGNIRPGGEPTFGDHQDMIITTMAMMQIDGADVDDADDLINEPGDADMHDQSCKNSKTDNKVDLPMIQILAMLIIICTNFDNDYQDDLFDKPDRVAELPRGG